MNKFSILAVAGACLITAGGWALAADTAPSKPMDKAAIEKIVHDYLVEHPEILSEMTQKLQDRQDAQDAADQKAREQAVAKLGLKPLLDPKVAYVTGPADAKVTVAEFFDYRCAHCKASLPAVKKLFETDKSVRFALIEYPILTRDSLVAAHAAVAARKQPGKYMAFHFALMQTNGDLPIDRILAIAAQTGLDVEKLKKDMNAPDVEASLKATQALAKQLHVDGTPTFIINKKIMPGELSDDELSDLIKDARAG